MTLTVRDFSDLLRIVNTHPKWRHKMVKALFPEVDTKKAFQDLAEAKRISETTLARLERHIERMDRQMKIGFAEAKAEYSIGFDEADKKRKAGFAEAERKREAGFAEMKAEYRAGFAEAKREREAGFAEAKRERTEIRRDVAMLKGMAHEDFYFKKADAVFGGYLRNGKNATAWIADRLYEAQNSGKISQKEALHVRASDLLWRGKLRGTGDEVILVLEASWFIERHDIERAAERADILRRININAIPVAAGRKWIPEMRQLAITRRVVMTDNGRVDDESWQLALEG